MVVDITLILVIVNVKCNIKDHIILSLDEVLIKDHMTLNDSQGSQCDDMTNYGLFNKVGFYK